MTRLAIVGSTATGKTRLAVDLARRVGGVELVSVDAMAVYRGLDIGTAKPDRRERSGVRWHLVDIVAPSTEFSVARFQQMARDAIDRIEAAGHTPWLVGGTGLYHRAVIDDLDIPPHFPAIRMTLESEAAEDDGAVAALYARLDAADPVAARRTEPNNARRIVRALEVIEGTGRRFSSFGPGLSTYAESPWTIVGLELDRDSLDASIERRLDHHLADGFVEETAGLLARPGGLSRTARQALGYRELIEHLEGVRDFAGTREAILARTRTFARRQESWFRRDPRVRWMRADRSDLVDAVEALVISDRL
ncbi:MAG TPA: tRNA (adenosine(37)-N6)-dimethylallyltransferase MiaA [Acidimicrobiales bacterium]|nr:tRNA (adenosine(37)-N6)-dimethylallyltransferase MiaA [Acidimicrobiales bacterium]